MRSTNGSTIARCGSCSWPAPRAAALVPGRGTGSRTAGGGGLLDEGGAGLTIRATTAEATGLDDASVDLVVYAQSWHWVDAGRAGAEAARILAPGGAIAAAWNQMDVSDPWVRRLTRIMRSGDVHRVDDPPAFGPAFTALRLHQVRWTDRMTRAELMNEVSVTLEKTPSASRRSRACAPRTPMPDWC